MRTSGFVTLAALSLSTLALAACGSEETVEQEAPAGDVEASADATMEAALAAGDAAEEEVEAKADETSEAVDDALSAAEARTEEIAGDQATE